MRDVVTLIKGKSTPALILERSENGKSQLGGTIDLPRHINWPTKGGKNLRLLARLDLAELQRNLKVSWLPKDGQLAFFYDCDELPWGFDPKDEGGWSVIHLSGQHSDYQPDSKHPTDKPAKLVDFHPHDSILPLERLDYDGLSLSEEEIDALIEFKEKDYYRSPLHQVCGFPFVIQDDDMELECQLVSSGLYCGDGTGYDDPRAAELEPHSKEWRLLLQVDTDEEIDFFWGDCGMLYFWIREEDAASGKFDKAWVVLQCG